MISVWLSFIAIVEFLNSRALRDNLPYIYGQFLGNLPLTTVVKPPPSPYFWQFCWGKISIFSRHRGQRDLKSNSRPLRQIESSRGKNVRSHFPNGFFFCIWTLHKLWMLSSATLNLSMIFSVTRRSWSDNVSESVSQWVTLLNRVDWCDPGEWRYLLRTLLTRLW